MTTPLSLAMRQLRLLPMRDEIAALWFYTGTDLPSTPETATAEVKLGVISAALPSGSVGASGNVAVLTLTVPQVSPAIATGLVGWVRFVDAAGNGIADCPVVEVGTAGPVVISDLQVYAGGEMQLISCVIAE